MVLITLALIISLGLIIQALYIAFLIHIGKVNYQPHHDILIIGATSIGVMGLISIGFIGATQ